MGWAPADPVSLVRARLEGRDRHNDASFSRDRIAAPISHVRTFSPCHLFAIGTSPRAAPAPAGMTIHLKGVEPHISKYQVAVARGIGS
jgi:hypothetical protein